MIDLFIDEFSNFIVPIEQGDFHSSVKLLEDAV